MKTIEEFYKEIAGSKELQDELKNISEGMLEAFLKKHDCDASVEDFKKLLKSQSEGESGDDDAAAAAGGMPAPWALERPYLWQ